MHRISAAHASRSPSDRHNVRGVSRRLVIAVVALALGGCRDKRRVPPPNLPVTIEQARATALAAVPGRVELEELDYEEDYAEGRWVYEFEIVPAAGTPKQEVDIDAITGAVLVVKPDD